MTRFGKITRHIILSRQSKIPHTGALYIKARRFTKEDNDVCVLNSDKENNTVVMKRDEYERKVG